MIVENLQTLKIHKLTEAQYQRTLSEGNIDPNALYLTPDESLIIDNTLSIDGAAADAAAVGDANADIREKIAQISSEKFDASKVVQNTGDSIENVMSQAAVTTALENLTTLPYGGSKEWLETNGDTSKLYQIDGYVWGYIESDGWTKSGTRFLVVSSESQMVNQGGTGYLLRSGSEGTVYAYSEASGDKDVPVYDALPETANEGDIVAVGGRKYKAVLTTTQAPDYTNLADPTSSDWAEGYRFNSSGELKEAAGFIATNYIPVTLGDVIRMQGIDTVTELSGKLGVLTDSKIVISIAKISAETTITDVSVDTTGARFTIEDSRVAYIRFTGTPNGTSADVIITVNEEIATKTETMVSWTDIGEYVAPVEAGWNATEETYAVIDTLSAMADNGDTAVYSGDGYVYSYIIGSGWMAMSKYSPPTLSVDGELSDTSTKAVQNKVVKAAIDEVDAKTTSNANKILTLQNQVEALGGGSSSETATIPSYWEEMVAAKTETIKALQQAGGKNCVCFAWASDTHIPDEDPGTNKGYSGGRTTDLGKVMAKMMDDCEVPFAVLSGDINTRASYSTEAEYLETLAKVPVYLAPLWGTDRLLMAMGNHDGVWGDSTGYYRHQFTPERLWQVFFRGQALDFRRVFSEDGLYYYVDNVPQKTRFIVLNSQFGGEYAENENGWAVNNRFATSCYGQAQLEWLANVALDMPEGYGAVITAHAPPNITYTVDKEQLIGIINAYCNKTTFSGSYTAGVDGWSNSDISVDFTDAKGDIIALFAGHIHWDTVDITTLACPLITIISAGAPVNTVNVVDGETVPVRYPWGTDQETSFDVVTINRTTRTIYCTRVGAGEDREISY